MCVGESWAERRFTKTRAMIPDAKHFYESWPRVNGAAKSRAPEISKAFGPLFQSMMKPGALGTKEKELIALGIAVAVRCEPCIYLHVEKCLHAGATPAEVMESAGVAVMMGGGPVTTYVPVVAAALDHLAPVKSGVDNGAATPH